MGKHIYIYISLITICNTVDNTQATSTTRDIDTIGVNILGASTIDWKMIAATSSFVQINISCQSNPDSLDMPLGAVLTKRLSASQTQSAS